MDKEMDLYQVTKLRVDLNHILLMWVLSNEQKLKQRIIEGPRLRGDEADSVKK